MPTPFMLLVASLLRYMLSGRFVDLGHALPPGAGWGMQSHDSSVMQLQQRIAGLEKQLADIKSSSAE